MQVPCSINTTGNLIFTSRPGTRRTRSSLISDLAVLVPQLIQGLLGLEQVPESEWRWHRFGQLPTNRLTNRLGFPHGTTPRNPRTFCAADSGPTCPAESEPVPEGNHRTDADLSWGGSLWDTSSPGAHNWFPKGAARRPKQDKHRSIRIHTVHD